MMKSSDTETAFEILERRVYAALELYSNVHRGTGHFSMASTVIFERAREMVLEIMGLAGAEYEVLFCTPACSEALRARLRSPDYRRVSTSDVGLPLGVEALVVGRRALPGGAPLQSGGGVVKMVSSESVVWADVPDRYEAGTPGILNVVAFTVALQLQEQLGPDAFDLSGHEPASVEEILYRDELEDATGEALLHALRRIHIGRDVHVPTESGPRPYTNLDNGASTPTFAPIWEAVRRSWRQPPEVQQALVREVEALCRDFLGAPRESYDLLFTANTTEALNLVARHLDLGDEPGTQAVVINTLLEHHSNELPWRQREDVTLVRVDVDGEGFIDLEQLEALLRAYNVEHAHGDERVRLVAVCGASNVLGTFNDLNALGRMAHRHGALLLVDAAQLVAHRPIDVDGESIDILAFSAHKVYAPFGSGALLIRRGLLDLAPEERERERVRASGEANVVGIAALGKALDLLRRIGLDVVERVERELTAQLLDAMATIPGLRIYGVRDPGSPRFERKGPVVVFSLEETPHNLAATRLAERGGIGVRNGCFCAHLLTKRLMRIHPLREFAAQVGLYVLPDFTASILPGLVRVSVGLENDAGDVETFIEALEAIAREPRSPLERFLGGTLNATPFVPRTSTTQAMEAFVEAAVQRVYGEGMGET